MADEQKVIVISPLKYWTPIVSAVVFMVGFWASTGTRLTILELKSNTGDSDKSRMETKIDKMSLDFIDLKSDVRYIKTVVDIEKTSKTQ